MTDNIKDQKTSAKRSLAPKVYPGLQAKPTAPVQGWARQRSQWGEFVDHVRPKEVSPLGGQAKRANDHEIPVGQSWVADQRRRNADPYRHDARWPRLEMVGRGSPYHMPPPVNAAAMDQEAYDELRKHYPANRILIAGENINTPECNQMVEVKTTKPAATFRGQRSHNKPSGSQQSAEFTALRNRLLERSPAFILVAHNQPPRTQRKEMAMGSSLVVELLGNKQRRTSRANRIAQQRIISGRGGSARSELGLQKRSGRWPWYTGGGPLRQSARPEFQVGPGQGRTIHVAGAKECTVPLTPGNSAPAKDILNSFGPEKSKG